MRIAAVATVLNETDIIEMSIGHMRAQGVHEIVVADASKDGTREKLDALGVSVFSDGMGKHYQPRWINLLARHAYSNGCDWILPFDADEFWYPTNGGTIAETLCALPDSVRKLHVRAFQHRDPDHREVKYRSLGKVAFRFEPGCEVWNGNHEVTLPSGACAIPGVLDLREWQFRSFEHLVRKSRERVERIDPSLPVTEGAHQRRLYAMTRSELKAEWDRMQAVPVVFDPIP